MEGKDLTICAVGSMVSAAYAAAVELSKQGISCEVINARYLKPIDASTILGSAQKTGKLITIEENVATGGFGQAVRSALHEANLGSIPHTLMSLPDAFVEHGAQPLIRKDVGLTAEDVVEQALLLIGVNAMNVSEGSRTL